MGGTETQGGANNAGAMGLYDPGFNYGGYDMYGGISKGFQQLGSGIAAGSQAPNYMTGVGAPTPFATPQGAAPGLIPETQSNDLMAVLQRLLGGMT